MFIREGTRVLFSDLMKGMVIQSGNDASCAIEHVAASEEGFVQLMNLYAREMGLKNTHNSGMRVGGQILIIILLPGI